MIDSEQQPPICSSCGYEIHRDDARDFMGGQTRHRHRGRCIELIRMRTREDRAELERLQRLLADVAPAAHLALEADRAARTGRGDPDHDVLQAVARGLDRVFNGEAKGDDRQTGFCLLVYGFNAPGIANYVSNNRRQDMIEALRETADRLERNQDNRRF